jgi:PIN domain nuclease of toxin-antitoxin system
MMYVLDTCVLLWWTLDPENLSPLAAKHCKNIDTQGACIASVSSAILGEGLKFPEKCQSTKIQSDVS